MHSPSYTPAVSMCEPKKPMAFMGIASVCSASPPRHIYAGDPALEVSVGQECKHAVCAC